MARALGICEGASATTLDPSPRAAASRVQNPRSMRLALLALVILTAPARADGSVRSGVDSHRRIEGALSWLVVRDLSEARPADGRRRDSRCDRLTPVGFLPRADAADELQRRPPRRL